MAAKPTNDFSSFSLGRKFGSGIGVLIASLSMLVVVVCLNYLAARHFKRWDCTGSDRWQLSPRTERVLESLGAEVKVIVYYSQQERLYQESVDLLREYAARSPYIRVQLIDPERNPVEANIVKNRYQLAALNQKNLILFDCNGRTKAVYQQALSEYDLEPVPGSPDREFRRRTRNFRGEQQFTSALVGVINPRRLKACFLQGHGEHSITSTDEQTGYSKLAGVLLENGIQPELLSLLGTAEVPADCSLLVIAGLVDPLSQDELAKIDRFLNSGGRLLALFNYRSFGKRTGLEEYLASWGLMVSESLVLDPMRSTPNSRGQDLVLTINEQAAHPLIRPLAQQSVHLLLPRAVSEIKTGGRGTEVLRVSELVHTTPDAMMVRSLRDGMPDINPARDPRGSFSLMAAVEKGTVPGVKTERGSTRLVVAGDSMFLSNQMIESVANRDFAAHAANWLVDQNYLLSGLGPRTVNEYRLNLTREQVLGIHGGLLAGLPLAVLAIGALVWLRRRR